MKAAWIVRSIRRQVHLHRLTVLAVSASFFLIALVAGTSRLGVRTVGRWGSFVGQNVHLIVYLAEDVDGESTRDLAEIVRRVPNIAEVTTLEPAQAFTRFKDSALAFGADAKTVDMLEPSYFPRSMEVRLSPTPDLAERANDLAKRLRGVPGVLQVDAMGAGVARLAAWTRLGKRLGTSVLGTLGLLSLAGLITCAVRIRRALARRAAILIQLGATRTAIRLPASLWMALAAALGGAAAAATLAWLWQPLVAHLERGLGMLGTSPLPTLGRTELAAGLAVLVSVGWVVGYWSTPVSGSDGHA